MTTHTCTVCKKDKPYNMYYVNNREVCRSCTLLALKETAQRQDRLMSHDQRLRPDFVPVRNSTMSKKEADRYTAPELAPYEGRPNCNQGLACPSRMGDKLIYRDGREEAMA